MLCKGCKDVDKYILSLQSTETSTRTTEGESIEVVNSLMGLICVYENQLRGASLLIYKIYLYIYNISIY